MLNDLIDTKFYKGTSGKFYKIEQYPEYDHDGPRGWDNATVMLTFGGDYSSPDSNGDYPFPSDYISTGYWRGAGEVDMRRLRKWVALFGAEVGILDIAAIGRGYDGTLSIDWDAEDEYEGVIMITRKSWGMCMGETPLEGETWPDGRKVPSAREVMQSDVDAYNNWIEGNWVWVAVHEGVPLFDREGNYVTTNWDHTESLGGIDDANYAWEAGVDMINDDVTEVTEEEVGE
jgi:hypothetical protein